MEKTFPAVPCKTWQNFMTQNCDSGSGVKAYMGINADSSLTGNFYLQTNGESPFNRGNDGTVYKDFK